MEEGMEGIGEIVTAESSAEDALDDDDRLREILDSYELGERFFVSDAD